MSYTLNPNRELYTNKLAKSTTIRKKPFDSEAHILEKYLTDKSKRLIEGGCGAGMLTSYLSNKGFENVNGFDIVPELITYCKRESEKSGSKIKYWVGDAANLEGIENSSYDYLIYLQNVMCFVPEELFQKALNESYRIATQGAVVIYSFLNYRARTYNPILGLIVNFLRGIRGEKKSKYYLPWLKHNFTEYNWKFLNKNQPRLFWTKKEDIVEILKTTGFTILEASVGQEIIKGASDNTMFIICKKD